MHYSQQCCSLDSQGAQLSRSMLGEAISQPNCNKLLLLLLQSVPTPFSTKQGSDASSPVAGCRAHDEKDANINSSSWKIQIYNKQQQESPDVDVSTIDLGLRLLYDDSAQSLPAVFDIEHQTPLHRLCMDDHLVTRLVTTYETR